jgi:hypothetical protein
LTLPVPALATVPPAAVEAPAFAGIPPTFEPVPAEPGPGLGASGEPHAPTTRPQATKLVQMRERIVWNVARPRDHPPQLREPDVAMEPRILDVALAPRSA